MALVGCAIANNGVVNQPYLVKQIKNPSGEVSYTSEVSELCRPVSSEIAKRVATVLEGVVKRGTGVDASISGITIAGKTGTAEKGGGRDDSWFVGFANDGKGGSVVIAIVLEDSHDAPAKASNVLKTALKKQGRLS